MAKKTGIAIVYQENEVLERKTFIRNLDNLLNALKPMEKLNSKEKYTFFKDSELKLDQPKLIAKKLVIFLFDTSTVYPDFAEDVMKRVELANQDDVRVVKNNKLIGESETIPNSRAIDVSDFNNLNNWWPQLLLFLFPVTIVEMGSSPNGIFLFDETSAEEKKWYSTYQETLRTYGIECLWPGHDNFNLSDIHRTFTDKTMLVVLANNGGYEMVRKFGPLMYDAREANGTVIIATDNPGVLAPDLMLLGSIIYTPANNPETWVRLLYHFNRVSCTVGAQRKQKQDSTGKGTCLKVLCCVGICFLALLLFPVFIAICLLCPGIIDADKKNRSTVVHVNR